MSTSKIVKCNCKSPDQDKIHGVGMRLANQTKAGSFRCTVCLTLHGSSGFTPQAEKVAAKVAAKESAKKEVKKEDNKKGKKKGKKKGSLKGGKR